VIPAFAQRKYLAQYLLPRSQRMSSLLEGTDPPTAGSVPSFVKNLKESPEIDYSHLLIREKVKDLYQECSNEIATLKKSCPYFWNKLLAEALPCST